jgi:CheY-like chemotaxis protein
VKLPVVSQAAPRREQVPLPAMPLPKGRLLGSSVLVVDDDADTRELMSSVLIAAGAQVHLAASAEEALMIGVETRPDAIVSDIGMPGQDGYRLMRQLTAALGPDAPRVKVALTAFASAGDRDRAIDAGFQRHISKPVDPLSLVDILEQMLSSRV